MKERKTFEHRIGERVFHFMCDMDSPIGEAKDALCHFVTHVVNFEKSIIADMESKKAEEPQQEEVVQNAL